MIEAGVGHRQRLQNAADALPFTRLRDKMKVIVLEAITQETEGITLLGLLQSTEKGQKIARTEEDSRTIAAVDGMVNYTIANDPRQASHLARLIGGSGSIKDLQRRRGSLFVPDRSLTAAPLLRVLVRVSLRDPFWSGHHALRQPFAL